MTDETNTAQTDAANDQTTANTDAPQAAAGAGTAATNPPADAQQALAQRDGGILGSIENKFEAAVGDVKEFFGEHPTPTEARAMFAEKPSLSFVVTTEGGLHRDGTLDPISAE